MNPSPLKSPPDPMMKQNLRKNLREKLSKKPRNLLKLLRLVERARPVGQSSLEKKRSKQKRPVKNRPPNQPVPKLNIKNISKMKYVDYVLKKKMRAKVTLN